jgi:hypothetical protein
MGNLGASGSPQVNRTAPDSDLATFTTPSRSFDNLQWAQVMEQMVPPQGLVANVLAIHGVGNPHEGKIAEEVRNVLSGLGPSRHIEEFNWNKLVLHPLTEGQLKYQAIDVLAFQLASATVICTDTKDPAELSSAERVILKLQSVALTLAEISISTAFIALLFGIYYFVLISIFVGMTSHDDHALTASSLHAPVLVVSSIAFFATGAFVCSSVLLSVMRLDWGPFWIAIRCATILWIRPLLLSSISVFFLPWHDVSKRLLGFLLQAVRSILMLALPLGLGSMVSSGR